MRLRGVARGDGGARERPHKVAAGGRRENSGIDPGTAPGGPWKARSRGPWGRIVARRSRSRTMNGRGHPRPGACRIPRITRCCPAERRGSPRGRPADPRPATVPARRDDPRVLPVGLPLGAADLRQAGFTARCPCSNDVPTDRQGGRPGALAERPPAGFSSRTRLVLGPRRARPRAGGGAAAPCDDAAPSTSRLSVPAHIVPAPRPLRRGPEAIPCA